VRVYRVFNLNDLQWLLDKDESDPRVALQEALTTADGDGMDLVGVVPAAPPQWPETLFIFRDKAT
jgi:translation initiation factor IF-3